jgi:hypothetical protein
MYPRGGMRRMKSRIDGDAFVVRIFYGTQVLHTKPIAAMRSGDSRFLTIFLNS